MALHRRILLAATLAILAGWMAPHDAAADRFHVRNGGTLASGPSTPDDWELANCYGDLALALASCAAVDSVLLYPEVHALAAPALMPALLTNQGLAAEPGGAEIDLDVLGTLTTHSTVASCELRGLVIRGGEPDRAAPALVVTAGGTLTQVTVTGATFTDLWRSAVPGLGGAAITAPGVGGGLVIVLDGCTFTNNRCTGRGGAVDVSSGYAVTATDCAFTENESLTGNGGAIGVGGDVALGTLLAEDCVFTGNRAAGNGGAIETQGASVTLRRCTVVGSRSGVGLDSVVSAGAGVRINHASGHTDPVTAIVENCTFEDNRGSLENSTTAGDGGGLQVRGGPDRVVDVRISDCVFRGNFNAQGGGVYIGRYAIGLVEYCRFLENTAWYQGGGAMKGGFEDNAGELVTFVYCEFIGNRAGYDADGNETGEYSRGGGVMVRNYPRADLFNCTFVDNTVNTFVYAVGDGFAHAIENGEWTAANQCSLVNCVFWGVGNDEQAHSEDIGGMAVVSHVAAEFGQLLLGIEPESPVWLDAYPFTSPVDLNPAEGSPLIDAGVDLGYLLDLGGRSVPSGAGVDIGAYEYHNLIGVDDPLPARPMDLTVYPNPFNPRTTLSARLDAASSVLIAIYDSRGYRVTELFRGDLPAGTHEMRWDGRDDRGRAVATGTYLARLEATGRAPVVTKLVLVR